MKTQKIIPILFNMRLVFQDKYYNVSKNKEKYMVQTRSQTKASGIQLPEVHGSRKRLDPHRIPVKQSQPIVETIPVPILDMNKRADSYTWIRIDKPYIALNPDAYISI